MRMNIPIPVFPSIIRNTPAGNHIRNAPITGKISDLI